MELSRKHAFTAPSGAIYEIREQNGSDDDILSNSLAARNLKNLTNFISAIVVSTTATPSGRLSPEEAYELPVLDKYCIILYSRIFSLGEELVFSHEWELNTGKTETIEYEVDIKEFLFSTYDLDEITEVELLNKPDAVPFYPSRDKLKDIEITTSTGKELLFDVLTSASEAEFLNLPPDKQTRNAILSIRNLRLKVGDKYEKVSNYAGFSVKEMSEIRKVISATDPKFLGNVKIVHPTTNQSLEIPIMAVPGFFYLEEE